MFEADLAEVPWACGSRKFGLLLLWFCFYDASAWNDHNNYRTTNSSHHKPIHMLLFYGGRCQDLRNPLTNISGNPFQKFSAAERLGAAERDLVWLDKTVDNSDMFSVFRLTLNQAIQAYFHVQWTTWMKLLYHHRRNIRGLTWCANQRLGSPSSIAAGARFSAKTQWDAATLVSTLPLGLMLWCLLCQAVSCIFSLWLRRNRDMIHDCCRSSPAVQLPESEAFWNSSRDLSLRSFRIPIMITVSNVFKSVFKLACLVHVFVVHAQACRLCVARYSRIASCFSPRMDIFWQ